MPDVYSIITEQVIKQMESGTAPWRKSWNSAPPANLVSKKGYRGINVFLLAYQGYGSPYWLTFDQAKKLGGNVKKGEHSTLVVFWKHSEYRKHNEETGEDEKRQSFLLRYYRVFNLLQCEGLDKYLPSSASRPDSIDACEKIVAGYKNPPAFERNARAAYSPETDTLYMPDKLLFHSIQEYYSTLFHEMTHSTGHPKRLDRFVAAEKRVFGSESYSKEELIAEFGAAMLCGISGIGQAVLENSAAYLATWKKRIQEDGKLLVSAASAAQKACDLIIGEPAKEESAEQEQEAELVTA